jgi:hypothetical protein
VKFGLPFGAATHILLWGAYDFKAGYQTAGQLTMFYDSVKWATDYMLNAYNPTTHELVAQVCLYFRAPIMFYSVLAWICYSRIVKPGITSNNYRFQSIRAVSLGHLLGHFMK